MQSYNKFDFKFSNTSVQSLDAIVYKNKEQNKLLTTVYDKPIERRNFVRNASIHPISLIKSIPYSQVLCLKKICTKASELSKNLQVLNESLINWDFNEKFLDIEFQWLSEIEKNAITSTNVERKILK